MVDWTKPIEAVHEDGRVQSVVFVDYDEEKGSAGKPDESGDYYTSAVDGTIIDIAIWYPDGSTWAENSPGWRIRNRAEPANDELAELRAWRDAAIKGFPDLGAKVDPDFAEAKSIMRGSEWSSGTGCKTPDDHDFEGTVCDVVLKGIKRGRELERYAKGLTTPKD